MKALSILVTFFIYLIVSLVPFNAEAGPPILPGPKGLPPKGEWGHMNKLKPDLTIQKIVVIPANPTTRSTIHITAFILNQGMSAAGPFEAQLWIGGSSKPLSFKIKGLAPGKSYGIRWNGKLAIARTYRVRAVADSQNQVRESNEKNNQLYKDFTVKNPPLVHVTSARWEPLHQGGKTKLRITVIFSGPVDKSSITDMSTFRLYSYTPSARKAVRGHITWQSNNVMIWTSYDDVDNFLVFDPDAEFEIILDGSRAKDRYGQPLDGDNNGKPGGNYHEGFTWIG